MIGTKCYVEVPNLYFQSGEFGIFVFFAMHRRRILQLLLRDHLYDNNVLLLAVSATFSNPFIAATRASRLRTIIIISQK